ncbi:MAG: vWA domain-containing protein [Planctomycetota bacterium]|jgi:hypothetical protein
MTAILLLLVVGGWHTADWGKPRLVPLQEDRTALLPMAGRQLRVTMERNGQLIRFPNRSTVRKDHIWIELAIGAGGRSHLVKLRVKLEGDAISYCHRLERRGEILLEGRLRAYALIDGNQDLRFDDPHHDAVRFDVNGDGVAGQLFGIDEEFGCGAATYRFERGDPTGSFVSFVRRGDQPGPAQVPDDVRAVRALIEQGDRAARLRLRVLRNREAVAALIGALRKPERRAFALSVLRDVATPEVAAALLQLRKKEPVAADRALLGQDDARVVRALRKDLEQGTLSQQRQKLRALFLVGLEHPAIAAVARDLLADPDWKWRVLALLELRHPPISAPIARRVVEALRDEVWQVRLAAAEAIGAAAGMRDVIEPMIEAMEREPRARVRHALGRSLHGIVKVVDYKAWAPGWRRFWEEQGRDFVVPSRPVGRMPTTKVPKERKTVASFYGLRIDSSRVVFLIDASGSMAIEDREGARSRFDVVREELDRAIRTLPTGSRANVVLFSDRIWSWKSRITELTPALRKSLRRILDGRSPRGGTHLYDGFEAAFRDQEADTIVLLSDGQASGGKVKWPDEIERAILDWNALRRLTIHCVAVGYHNPMLRRLAEKSGGQYLKK